MPTRGIPIFNTHRMSTHCVLSVGCPLLKCWAPRIRQSLYLCEAESAGSRQRGHQIPELDPSCSQASTLPLGPELPHLQPKGLAKVDQDVPCFTTCFTTGRKGPCSWTFTVLIRWRETWREYLKNSKNFCVPVPTDWPAVPKCLCGASLISGHKGDWRCLPGPCHYLALSNNGSFEVRTSPKSRWLHWWS